MTMHIPFSQNGGAFVDQVADVLTGDEDTRFMRDIVTPKYRKLSHSGEIVINPMQSAHSVISSGGAMKAHAEKQTLVNGVWTRIEWFDYFCQGPFSARFRIPYTSLASRCAGNDLHVLDRFGYNSVTATEQQLVARVLANASSSDAASLVTLAEFDKTVDYFTDLVTSVRRINDFLADLRSRDLTVFRYLRNNYRWKYAKSQIPKFCLNAVNAWLGYRYGLMSTYYDVVSLLKAGNNIGRPRRARYSTSLVTQYDSGLLQGATEKVWTRLETQDRYSRSTTSSAGCLVQFDPASTSFDTFGGGQVLSAAWELVPYSFVVDWFCDVGKRIQALDGMILRPTLGSWITHRSTLNEWHSWDDVPRTKVGTDGIRYWMTPGSSDSAWLLDTCKYVERKANPKLSPIPSVNVRLNTSRIVDSISLMIQQASRLKKILRN